MFLPEGRDALWKTVRIRRKLNSIAKLHRAGGRGRPPLRGKPAICCRGRRPRRPAVEGTAIRFRRRGASPMKGAMHEAPASLTFYARTAARAQRAFRGRIHDQGIDDRPALRQGRTAASTRLRPATSSPAFGVLFFLTPGVPKGTSFASRPRSFFSARREERWWSAFTQLPSRRTGRGVMPHPPRCARHLPLPKGGMYLCGLRAKNAARKTRAAFFGLLLRPQRPASILSARAMIFWTKSSFHTPV